MADVSTVVFAPAVDPWPIADDWANRKGYRVTQHGEWGRRYERGDGFFSAKSGVQVSLDGANLRVDAWVVFWLSGQQLDVRSGQFFQSLARWPVRRQANALLTALGGPLIT